MHKQKNIERIKMSKKININIPNKVKPNLVVLFHEYLSRKSKEYSSSRSLGYGWDDEDYEDMVEFWDAMYPGWDDGLDDEDIVYPPKNNHIIVLNPKERKKNKLRDVFDNFWNQQDREDKWNKKKKSKHTKSKSKGKSKIIDLTTPYSGEEEEYDFNDVDLLNQYENKEIWFYPDYHDKEDRLEFNSIKEFSDYCDSMGYSVPTKVVSEMAWRYESHCCLSKEAEDIGLLEIACGHSYGDMYYDVCDDSELGAD